MAVVITRVDLVEHDSTAVTVGRSLHKSVSALTYVAAGVVLELAVFVSLNPPTASPGGGPGCGWWGVEGLGLAGFGEFWGCGGCGFVG